MHTDFDYEHYLDVAINACIQAGKKVFEIYQSANFDIDYKSDSSPLTKADLASHDIIAQLLKPTNIPVLSEEGNLLDFNQRSEISQLWIVDPLDGTKEFISRNDEFTVNIAMVVDQKVALGVVYAPVTHELYYAVVGQNAFKILFDPAHRINLQLIKKKALKLPVQGRNDVYKVVASRSHMSKETEDYITALKTKYQNIEITSRGSSLKLCIVAEGLADCYPRFAPTMEWDVAAGHAVCKAAGIVVLDWFTKKEMEYNKENLLNNWFVVNPSNLVTI